MKKGVWLSVKEYLPQSSTPLNIYQVLIKTKEDVKSGEWHVGWWSESANRWYMLGSPSEWEVLYWMDVPKLKV